MSASGQLLESVDNAMNVGRYLAAHDLAMSGLETHSDSVLLKHRAVLAIARTGATKRAVELFNQLGLGEVSSVDQKAKVEIGSLKARIEKDRGLKTKGNEAKRHFKTCRRALSENI